MKVVTAEEMRKAEHLTITSFGVTGQVLMETAGRACADVILHEFSGLEAKKAVVVAGKGNNGGDGYVIARCLARNGWSVKVLVLGARSDIGGDAATNLTLLDATRVAFCSTSDDIVSHESEIAESSIIIDALFGIGLSKEVSGVHAAVIGLINGTGRPVVAVDIPSGIDASTGQILGAAVRADITVSFGYGKLGHVLYPGRFYSGRLVTVDIGLPDQVMAEADTVEFLDAASIGHRIMVRDRCGHKGSYGHCLIVAGSTGKTGAAALAANSAVRTGSGLVTLAVPASLNHILEVKTTEAMTYPLHDNGAGMLGGINGDEILQVLAGKDALAVGPGISRHRETVELVRRLVVECPLPLVVDADGLNAIAEDVSILLKKKSRVVVLTPHPGEMARLSGKSIADIELDRVSAARDFAARYGVFVVLKGAGTIVAAPNGEVAINGSGNPGMASGGMGDVLTGVIVSLLGQQYSTMDACRVGVFLHGLAGDLAALEKGEIGICATDVQERLPQAYKIISET